MGCERMAGTLRFAHPTDSAGVSYLSIVIHGPPTLPCDGKSAEYFPQNHGGLAFHGTARRHASAAKKPRLAARKIACLQFAARLAGAVNVRHGSFWRTGFRCLMRLGISHRGAPTSFAAAPRHTAQVLQSAPDFRHDQTSRRAMRPKRLQRRAFSRASARLRPQLAFGLPQGA
jgi:hypothetical protein